MNRHASDPRPALRRPGAFTLVEVIVVIVIIAVLAGLVVPRLVGRIGTAKTGAAQASAATLANQVKVLMVDAGGTLPPDTSIRALFEKPADLDAAKWNGPYVDSLDKLKDPWGNFYVLVIPGQHNVDFDVVSYGADGKAGGEGENADIVKP
jgi:general secretion pathway protein G